MKMAIVAATKPGRIPNAVVSRFTAVLLEHEMWFVFRRSAARLRAAPAAPRGAGIVRVRTTFPGPGQRPARERRAAQTSLSPWARLVAAAAEEEIPDECCNGREHDDGQAAAGAKKSAEQTGIGGIHRRSPV